MAGKPKRVALYLRVSTDGQHVEKQAPRLREAGCEKVFTDVETGRVTEKLINLPLDFLVALCR